MTTLQNAKMSSLKDKIEGKEVKAKTAKTKSKKDAK